MHTQPLKPTEPHRHLSLFHPPKPQDPFDRLDYRRDMLDRARAVVFDTGVPHVLVWSLGGRGLFIHTVTEYNLRYRSRDVEARLTPVKTGDRITDVTVTGLPYKLEDAPF